MATFTVTDPRTGRKATLTSQDDTPPTPEELEQVFASVPADQPSAPGATNVQGVDLPARMNTTSPLTVGQQLLLSFTVNDDARKIYLQEEFKGADIDQDTEGNLMLNGLRINPEGFGFEDIAQNVGYLLPIGGQVAAGMAAVGSGVGTLTAVGAGMAGAGAGEAARIAIGRSMGLPVQPGAAAARVGMEAGFAGAGEVAGRGLARLARTPVEKIAQAWQTAMQKSGSFAPKVARFVGGVSKEAISAGEKYGFNEVLRPEYLRPDKTQELVKKTLFGRPQITAEAMERMMPRFNGTRLGTRYLAESVHDVANDSYDQLVKHFADLSDETMQTLRSSAPDAIFHPDNFASDRAYQLAEQFTTASEARLDELGKAVGRAEIEALKQVGSRKISVDDLGREANQLVRQTGLLGGIKVEGFSAQEAIKVPGGRELLDMRNLLGSTINYGPAKGRFAFFGGRAPVTNAPTEGVSLAQATKIRHRMDVLADSIFLNKRIPGEIKVATSKLVRAYRERVHTALGLGQEAKLFSDFKTFVDEIKLSRETFLGGMENTIKNWRAQSGTKLAQLDQVLSELPGTTGPRLRRQINLLNTADELRKVQPRQAASTFESMLNSQTLLDLSRDDIPESFLRQIDQSLKRGGQTRRAFYDEAVKSLAAKEFMKSSPQILRVQAVAGLFGLAVGGPAGAAGSIAMTTPGNVARFLKLVEKAGFRRPGTSAPAAQGAGRLERLAAGGSRAALAQLLQLGTSRKSSSTE